jgi:hypothetical protein
MTIYLRQSTASQEVPLGCFVDSTDGDTEESGLTIANTDIKIWKTGATTLASKNSGGATYISNGVYYTVLDATDTNTLGSLVIYVHVSGALAVKLECLVLSAAVYDAVVGTGDLLTAQADALLNRDMATGTDSGGRTVRNALRVLRNKVSSAAGTLTVTKEDDTTSAWTASLTTDVAAEPIVGVDPS